MRIKVSFTVDASGERLRRLTEIAEESGFKNELGGVRGQQEQIRKLLKIYGLQEVEAADEMVKATSPLA